ncbi:MAG: polysaccharide biosynthesis C-terminal domain-containing protein [Sulfobacillus thermotolerans]|uniref:Polysaccharide biosynthesis protein C-terminal domain-containing protein n=1 Tax=Sulfobacillus thermotolerans TaxID=338644 RepID=A0ABN5H1G9_9FIRM|nr:hypothetical protein BXT84_10805 [Sulfobacillus thermotolerans]MCY0909659.1 polysaccharide biosynthesis C-terminal domain-containing protein [Sulfobacillus thermotolerans]
MEKVAALKIESLSVIAKDWVRYIPTSIIPAVFAVIASAIFTRMFPPKVYGLYSLALALSVPFINVFSQPISQPIGRFYYEYRASNQLDAFYHTAGVLLFRALIILLSVELIAGFVLSLMDMKDVGLIIALMLYIPLQLLMSATHPILVASFQTRHYQIVRLSTTFLSVVLPLGLIALFGRHISFILWGNVLGLSAFLPIVLKWTGMHLNIKVDKYSLTIVQSTLKRFLHYGLPFIPWFLADSTLSICDRYILAWMHGPATVAIYAISYALAQQGVGLISGPFITASWPRILEHWKTDGRESTIKFLRNLTSIYFMLSGLVVGLLFVISKPLMEILVAKAYVSGHVIIGPVAIGVALWGVSMIGHKSMELTERNSLMVWDAGIAAILNILLNLWWVPHYGITGAAYATMVSYFIYTAFIWFQSHKGLTWQVPFPTLVFLLVLSSVGWEVTHAVTLALSSPFESLIASSIVYTGLYGTGLWLWLKSGARLLTTVLRSEP